MSGNSQYSTGRRKHAIHRAVLPKIFRFLIHYRMKPVSSESTLLPQRQNRIPLLFIAVILCFLLYAITVERNKYIGRQSCKANHLYRFR